MNYASFPSPFLTGDFERYFERGVEAGPFVTAVLCNNLKEACRHADQVNRHLLFDIVSWLYNEAPFGSWGSEDVYRDLIAHGGFEAALRARMERAA